MTARAALGWIRAHRRRRHRGLADWYTAALAALVLAPMVWAALSQVRFPLVASAVATGPGHNAAWLFTVGLVCIATWLGSSLLGPITAPDALAHWLLSSPIERGDLLGPTLTKVVTVAACAGFLMGLLAWAIIGGSPPWLAAAGTAAMLGALGAARVQLRGGWVRLFLALAAGVAVLGAAAAVLPPAAVAGAAATACLLASWREWRLASASLGDLSVASIAAATRTRSGVEGAMRGADTSMLFDVVAGRLSGRPMRQRLRAGGVGWAAIARASIAHLIRRPWLLAVAFGVGLAPALLLLASPSLGLALASLAALCALSLALDQLRTTVRSAGLARALGVAHPAAMGALALPAGLVAGALTGVYAAVLMVTGTPALTAALLAWAAVGSGCAGALLLSATAAPNFARGLVMTDVGPVPVGAIMGATAGIDCVAIAAVLFAVGAPPAVCGAWALVAVFRAAAKLLGAPQSPRMA